MATQGDNSERLYGFLLESFEPKVFERFLYFRVSAQVVRSVNKNSDAETYFFEIVQQLNRRGLINAELFDLLAKELPGKAKEAESLKELWLGEDEPRSEPSGPPRGFVRPEHPDIFISYAQVNDRKPPGVDHGWVTTLVSYLKDLLAQKLGPRESFWLWSDHQSPRALPLKPEIEAKVRETSIVVIVLSQDYLSSEWCEQEQRLLLEEVRRRVDRGARVFIVRYNPIAASECPQELRNLIGHSFCTSDEVADEESLPLGYPFPTPQDKEYYARVNTLAADLVKELRRARSGPDPALEVMAETATKITSAAQGPWATVPGVAGRQLAPDDTRPAVYLAEVPHSLDGLRQEVRSYLELAQLRVLPEVEYCRNAAAVNACLDQAVLFVQLLSEAPGTRLPDSRWSCVGLQSACARSHGIPVLQWRDRSLDPATVADIEHRELLNDPSVVVEDLLDFKRHVVRRVREILLPPAPEQRPGLEQLVFIEVKETEHDVQVSQQVSDILSRAGLRPTSSRDCADPDLADKHQENVLPRCAGMLWIYGSSPLWLTIKMDKKVPELKARYARLNLGLCDAAPTGKPRYKQPDVPHSIDCRAGVKGEAFAAFIAACKGVPQA
jgi:hypothetical protein